MTDQSDSGSFKEKGVNIVNESTLLLDTLERALLEALFQVIASLLAVINRKQVRGVTLELDSRFGDPPQLCLSLGRNNHDHANDKLSESPEWAGFLAAYSDLDDYWFWRGSSA